MTGIDFDRRRGKWTAPAKRASVEFLKSTFGNACLIWHGGAKKAPEAEAPLRNFAPAHKASDQNAKPIPRQSKQPPVALPEHWRMALHQTEEQLKVRRYSWRTVKSYLSHLRRFLYDHSKLTVDQLTSEVIRTYIVKRTAAGKYSEATQNQLLKAIKFWLEQVEGREKAFIPESMWFGSLSLVLFTPAVVKKLNQSYGYA